MRPGIIGWLVLLAIAAPLATRGVSAQSDPRLVAAVRDAQEGRGDSARVAVDRLLAATPPSDTLYPQILYTQAMVAGTAGDMRRLLQRVVVEYPTSSWADDALLRLVQMDYATRNYDGAARNLERLRTDFPTSPLMPQAAYWAGRTYFDANNPTAACRWLADGMAQSRDDVELQNQLGYLYQRCDLRADSTGPRTASDSARPDTSKTAAAQGPPAPGVSPTPPAADSARTTAAAPPAAPAPPARAVYRVQVAAVASRKSAEDAAKKARSLGMTVVTVQDKGLYKVRVGEYRTREAAQTAAASLKSRLGGTPFVVSEP
jgi:cell division septation protein DedD